LWRYSFAVIANFVVSSFANAQAPVDPASRFGKSPVTDDWGRISYIVDLRRDARLAYSDTAPPEDVARFHERHVPQFINMIADFERRYGFFSREQTSWVGDSFVAFLSDEQLRAVRSDPAVELVTEETYIELALPPWYDYTYSSSAPPYNRDKFMGARRDQWQTEQRYGTRLHS